jgi:hypothetical protein
MHQAVPSATYDTTRPGKVKTPVLLLPRYSRQALVRRQAVQIFFSSGRFPDLIEYD